MSLDVNYEQWGYGPPHPGAVLREQILPRLGLGRAELARRLDTSLRSLAGLLAEDRPVSLDMARRLGLAFGNGARYWLALQMQYDVWTAEQDGPLDIAPITVAKSAQAARAKAPLGPVSRIVASARR